ncbi:unnamed protein product [Albugo candida]|uniref:Uncharacterized protein n=1 Tax=Albugo candida TaxID=65357 RepID=A0A024FVK3_9STRA|nr:unnamed protein product [Albugo candida]|eukprot:CCI10937.1 unnamed protein product [Albugo candida]
MNGFLGKRMQKHLPLFVCSALIAGSLYAVYYAHNQQIVDKKRMRQGVLRDMERERLRIDRNQTD